MSANIADIWAHAGISALLEQGSLKEAAERLDPATRAQAARIASEMFATVYALGLESGAITVGQPANLAEVIPYLISIVRSHRLASEGECLTQ